MPLLMMWAEGADSLDDFSVSRLDSRHIYTGFIPLLFRSEITALFVIDWKSGEINHELADQVARR